MQKFAEELRSIVEKQISEVFPEVGGALGKLC